MFKKSSKTVGCSHRDPYVFIIPLLSVFFKVLSMLKKKSEFLDPKKMLKIKLKKKSALRAKVKKVPEKALNVLKIKSGTLKKNSGASRRQKG